MHQISDEELEDNNYFSEEDSGLESYRQRNNKSIIISLNNIVQELQQQQLAYKDQMLKFISNIDQDDNLSSPIPYPLETNYSTNQSQLPTPKQVVFDSIKNYQSNQVKQKYQSKMITNKPLTPTKLTSTNYQHSDNALQKQKLQTDSQKKSYNQHHNISPLSYRTKTQVFQTKPFFVTTTKKTIGTQTEKKIGCRIPKYLKFSIQLQKFMDISNPKETQTQENQPIRQQQKVNAKAKTEASEFLQKAQLTPKSGQKQQLPQQKQQQQQQQQQQQGKQKSLQFYIEQSKRLREGNDQQISTRRGEFNDSWYQSQTQWLQDKDERNYNLRIEKEERSISKDSFRPKIERISEMMVRQKYHNADFDQRMQQYLAEKKHKQILRKIEQEDQFKSSVIRMSPMSRKILRSVTPKYCKYDTSHSFTATNVSYFNQTPNNYQ